MFYISNPEKNMKKILYSVAIAGALMATSCDDLLDTENYSKADTSSFPKTEQDAEQILTSCYNALILLCSNKVESHTMFTHLMMSDEFFGAGSTSNIGAQSFDRMMTSDVNFFENAWSDYYQGVFRTNYALQAIPELDDAIFKNVDNKNYLLGQAHFLRAWNYWELANNFETCPLLLATEASNMPRTTVDSLYTQIAIDLTDAITLMPAKYGYSSEAGLTGRATKYAAEALLARIWMFYTGFYKKSDLAGISKSQIVTYLKDVRDNSKFGLETDPREIWPYTNEWSSGVAYGQDFDTYSNHNNLHWVGNHSKETVWAAHFSYVWVSNGNAGHNRLGEYMGLRNPSSSPTAECYPYGIGYTNGSVNPKLVEEWVTDPDYGTNDVRLWGSLFAVDEAEKVYSNKEIGGDWWNEDCYVELPNHAGNDSKEVEKTMFHNKKYMVNTAYSDGSKSNLYRNFFYAIPGFNGSNSNQFDNRNDMIYIRFADVLLMLDELEGTVDGMNQLRARAGLKPYDGYSFERLQKERRYELAFEGVRFNDLRRWYPDNAGEVISKNQVGAFCDYRGKMAVGGYTEIAGNGLAKRYKETRGFMNVPQSQIILSEGILTQTPGFDSEDTKSWMFSNGNLPYKETVAY